MVGKSKHGHHEYFELLFTRAFLDLMLQDLINQLFSVQADAISGGDYDTFYRSRSLNAYVDCLSGVVLARFCCRGGVGSH